KRKERTARAAEEATRRCAEKKAAERTEREATEAQKREEEERKERRRQEREAKRTAEKEAKKHLEDVLLTRDEAAEYIRKNLGRPMSFSTLTKICCLGEGPPVADQWGRRPLYSREGLRQWVESR